MSIVPFYDETILTIYRCGKCKGLFKEFQQDLSCCAIHPPGSCCHCVETKLTEKQFDKIRNILDKE